MPVQIIDVAGLKKSGKTTVVEGLIRELKRRGFKVGTIKKIHIPNFTIDQEGKDTFRHKQAGAEFVISLAPEEIALIKSNDGTRELAQVKDLVPDDTDFLVCEELNEESGDIIYIITLQRAEDLDETLKQRAVGERVIAISGVVSNSISSFKGYPVINTTTDPGIKKMVELIIKERNKLLK
jgi:molybdopterin-guanine dinucleotide biosynthesis protein B